jgi:tetratricopeptide (TPR) repeat protein
MKMKQLVLLVLLIFGIQLGAQSNSELLKHFEAYTKQMRYQGDIQGIINGMTHLNVLSPSIERTDTLAYIYMTEGKYVQALNTIGVDKKVDDSDIAVQVKAISLKAVNEPDLAVVQFEELFKREPTASIAYEIAEIYLQLNKLDEAEKHINYGLVNSKDDMKRTYYEQQNNPYQVKLKSGFMYLNALLVYNRDTKTNIDAAVDILDAALKASPSFNLIQLTKNELLRQKQLLQAQEAQPKQ